MPLTEFNALFRQEGMDAESALQQALENQQAERRQQTGGRKRQATPKTERVNWASPERAGEPQRGTVSEGEAEYVREHLEEVNARLSSQGRRLIDPTDEQMARRYGFPLTVEEAEIIEDIPPER
jgi:hypothetical protein